jgi:hypothetical protein
VSTDPTSDANAAITAAAIASLIYENDIMTLTIDTNGAGAVARRPC